MNAADLFYIGGGIGLVAGTVVGRLSFSSWRSLIGFVALVVIAVLSPLAGNGQLAEGGTGYSRADVVAFSAVFGCIAFYVALVLVVWWKRYVHILRRPS
jgi:hypothetical protein